jgi:CYTH domain
MKPTASSPEVEAKLALPGPVYWRLRDDPNQLGLPVAARALERQANLFYDTADGALRRAGASLRARRIAGRAGVEWTHKSGRRHAAGIQTVDEMVSWGRDSDDALSAAEGLPPVAAAVQIAGGQLRIDAASLTERLALRIAAPSGGEIEVALDRLRIPGDPVFVDYELEAEAHGASRTDVEALAADLMARLELHASTHSKRARLQAYADGRLGPPRLSASDCSARVADLVSRSGGKRIACVVVGGLTGSPTSRLAQDVERELAARALPCVISDSPDEWSGGRVRVWVGSSVHWRILRQLAFGGLASGGEETRDALERFGRQAAADRRLLEWRWRDADLVAVADEPSVASEPQTLPAGGAVYLPDDLSPAIGGRVVVERVGGGSRLTFTARAWPADLADVDHTFDLGAPAEQVAEVLAEVGYEEAGKT